MYDIPFRRWGCKPKIKSNYIGWDLGVRPYLVLKLKVMSIMNRPLGLNILTKMTSWVDDWVMFTSQTEYERVETLPPPSLNNPAPLAPPPKIL